MREEQIIDVISKIKIDIFPSTGITLSEDDTLDTYEYIKVYLANADNSETLDISDCKALGVIGESTTFTDGTKHTNTVPSPFFKGGLSEGYNLIVITTTHNDGEMSDYEVVIYKG